MDKLDALGKGRRLHRADTGRPCPLCPPPQAWYPSEPWRGSAPTPEARRGCPALFLWVAESGAGAGHKGCRRTPPRLLTSARASVRPSSVCCWDCGAGEAPTDSDRASPLPEPPDPSVAPSGGAETRGQAPRGREEAAPAGPGGAGRGRLPGPARRGLGSDYLEEQRRPGKAWRPPAPALNLNLYLTLCPEGGEGTHLSSDGGSSVHLSFWGGGEPALLGAGRELGISRCPWAQVRPKRPRTQGLWGPRVPSERRGAN